MSRYLGRRTCHICKQEISNAGGGYQHFMAHVRRGEAIKIPMRWGTFVFRPTPKDGAEAMQDAAALKEEPNAR